MRRRSSPAAAAASAPPSRGGWPPTGYRVCVAGRRREPLEAVAAEIGGHALRRRRRRPRRAAEAVVAGAVERFGRLDALVCCAGTGAGGRWSSRRSSAGSACSATNLTGVFSPARRRCRTCWSARGDRHRRLAGRRCARPRVGGLWRLQGGRDHADPVHGRRPRARRACGPTASARAGSAPTWPTARWTSWPARDTDREGAYALATAPVPARRPGERRGGRRAVAWLAGPQSTYVNGAVITVDGGSAVVDAASLAFGPDAAEAHEHDGERGTRMASR